MALRILGEPTVTAEHAVRVVLDRGALRPDFTATFVREVFVAGRHLGVDPMVALALWDVETGGTNPATGHVVGGRSRQWVDNGNPGGMGVFPDGTTMGYRFTADEAAWALTTHLACYAGVPVPPADPARDPRWDAVVKAGWRGVAVTVDDLANRWATDPAYGTKITARYRAIWGASTQQPQEPDMQVAFEKRIATNRLGEAATLQNADAWFTIHENGNPSSSPYDEAGFVRNGGGSQGVRYHFAVGVENGRPTIVQIFPVHLRGIHAGNATGNAIAIAVETCQAPPGALSDMTQAALRELVYMVVTHDPRIEGMDRGYRFSIDRINMHANWRGANPGCPENMLRYWGGIGPVIDAVRARLDAGPTTPVEPEEIGIGDTVAAIVRLNARAGAGLSHPVVTVLDVGTDMVAVGEAVRADGYDWLPVMLGDGRHVHVATGGSDGAYLTVIAKAEPPAGGDDEIGAVPVSLLSALFGAVDFDGTHYAFNPEGVVSNAWLEYATETGRFPVLSSVFVEAGQKVFRFADGLTITAPVDRPGEITKLEIAAD